MRTKTTIFYYLRALRMRIIAFSFISLSPAIFIAFSPKITSNPPYMTTRNLEPALHNDYETSNPPYMMTTKPQTRLARQLRNLEPALFC